MFLYVWLFAVFVIGLMVGSFLNVVVARLPLEKSLLWPGSRCGNCLQPIRWYDNLPLVSYLVLRGRCRTCKASFSPRYFLVELATGLGFTALFYLEVVLNIHDWPGQQRWLIEQGIYPWQHWVGFGFHALLFMFLMGAAVCDLSGREIPLGLTLTGTLIGLIGSTLLPWPWPQESVTIFQGPWWDPQLKSIPGGVYPWPFWGPLPQDWAGSWQMGLMTGLMGAVAGTFLMRGIAFLFGAGLGREALGLGDADLMMMAGAFLGWQLVVVALFVSVFPALVIGVIQLAVFKDRSQPFGPSLGAGILLTMLLWGGIGTSEVIRFLFFHGWILLSIVGLGALFMFGSAFILGIGRRGVPPAQTGA
ncbi:MAG: prepilin peptidase [Gemmataceae bacterium]|nr:prepilin peptidase [Gemmataceae bacterium]